MPSRSFATLLVGERSLLREGIRHLLCATDFWLRETADSVHDLTDEVVPPGALLVILDPARDSQSTACQIELFKKRHPTSRVAVIAEQHRVESALAAFKAGANLYVVKVGSAETFIMGLELVMRGETILPQDLLPYVQAASIANEDAPAKPTLPHVPASSALYAIPRLSASEERILQCIVEGNSNKVIARKMEVAEATVKVHVKAILRKIRVHNRTQAAMWAVNRVAAEMKHNSQVNSADISGPRIIVSNVSKRFREPLGD